MQLKQRGVLKDTIVVWGREFGRTVYSRGTSTPDATILRQPGVDHTRLTDNFQGRHYSLTDVDGKVLRPLLS